MNSLYQDDQKRRKVKRRAEKSNIKIYAFVFVQICLKSLMQCRLVYERAHTQKRAEQRKENNKRQFQEHVRVFQRKASEKSRIRETPTLSTDADSRTNAIIENLHNF